MIYHNQIENSYNSETPIINVKYVYASHMTVYGSQNSISDAKLSVFLY